MPDARPGLGRIKPPDWEHVEKYALAATPGGPPKGRPVVIGVNWYREMFTPVKNKQGHWWIVADGKLTTVEGGHCVCLEPINDPEHPGLERDAAPWHLFYNQGSTPACVGHGCSRMASLYDRKRFDAMWLYNEAHAIDGIAGPHDGTTVRAGLEILRTQGHRVAHGDVTTNLKASDPVDPAHGISAYRWATSADEVLAALGTPDLDHVTILQSWGDDWAERVYMPASVLDRLLRREDGEAAVATDR